VSVAVAGVLAQPCDIARNPEDFMFQLTSAEVAQLNRSQIVIGSEKHRDPRFRPYAFTEHGVAMLSSVLRSNKVQRIAVGRGEAWRDIKAWIVAPT
jgi:hypothetical protein